MAAISDVAQVRHSNLSLVLRELDRLGLCSRSDLRSATGLVSGSVSTMVDELLARGLVEEVGASHGARGRPRRLLQLRNERVLSIVVQLRLEDVVGELRDLAGNVLWSRTTVHDIGRGGSADLVAALASMLEATWLEAASRPESWVSEAILAVPAPIIDGTTIAASLDLGVGRTETLEAVRSRCTVTAGITLLNDGRLAALAEYSSLPVDQRPQSMACILGNESVGGGLILEGHLYFGGHRMAGEVGHISVDLDGERCRCGARGCLTQYLGVDAIAAGAGLPVGPGTTRQEMIHAIIARLERRDRQATEALARAGRALSAAVTTMSNYTDLELVVLSGDILQLEPWLREPLEETIRARTAVVEEFIPRIMPGMTGADAARIGAWEYARDRLLDSPHEVPLATAISPGA